MSKISQDELSKSFENALEKDEVTDIMGNPMREELETPVFEAKDWIKTDDGSEPELNKLTFQQSLFVLKGTQGKVLTIIDATFIDEKRLKYVKDLVKDAFSKQADWLFELATRDIEPMEITD